MAASPALHAIHAHNAGQSTLFALPANFVIRFVVMANALLCNAMTETTIMEMDVHLIVRSRLDINVLVGRPILEMPALLSDLIPW